MDYTDPFEGLREWERRECIKLRMSISQQLRGCARNGGTDENS